MPTKRLAMRNLREVFRLKWELGRSHREIAAAVGIGVSTVSLVVQRAVAAGLTTWAAVAELDGATLETRLYPPVAANSSVNRTKASQTGTGVLTGTLAFAGGRAKPNLPIAIIFARRWGGVAIDGTGANATRPGRP